MYLLSILFLLLLMVVVVVDLLHHDDLSLMVLLFVLVRMRLETHLVAHFVLQDISLHTELLLLLLLLLRLLKRRRVSLVWHKSACILFSSVMDSRGRLCLCAETPLHGGASVHKWRARARQLLERARLLLVQLRGNLIALGDFEVA